MKTKNILLFGLIIGLLLSCGKSSENISKVYSFSGKVQKGPFITGTTIILNELNSNLEQTGKSFTTSITSDDGSFSLKNIALSSNLALLTANGYHFSEIYGELTGGPLSLQAITDLSVNESVNINILTHLIKGRIDYLVSNGSGFQDANNQAKSEMLSFLGVTEPFGTDFEKLDISKGEDYNAVLLAFSIILQRYTNIWNERPALTAELTQLLSNLSSDFSTDGQITNKNLIDTLLYNISNLNLKDIRKNVENRYSGLGQTVTIPDFEKYVAGFQEKYCNIIYTSFNYPDSASPEPIIAPDSKLPNILVPSDTIFQAGKPYSIAAIIPLNSNLTIKFKSVSNNDNYALGGPVYGWEVINEYPNGITLNSQRRNELMTMLFHLEKAGNATIEYYENNSGTPTFTKKIKWE
ncbi:MAG: hypothetical protein WCK84_12480 [Bacteroidota bacterium]